jgi:hypothetical protein
MRSSSPPDRLLGVLLPILAVVAEGAWITVAYVAIETVMDGRAPLLGTFELSVAAGVTALGVRRRWLRPDDDPVQFLGFLAALGAAGWLWDATARDALLSGDMLGAISSHPGGWLTVVAAMRGVAHAIEVDDRAVTRLVLVGVPALAIPWGLGQLGPAALRPAFVDAAFVGSLTFVAAGFIAAGLARLQEIGRETGIDWRRDRSWLGTVLAVLAAVLVVGVPVSMLLGLPGDAVARGILGPLVGLLGYAFMAILTVTALVAALIATALQSIGLQLPAPMTPEELAALPLVAEYSPEQLRGPLTWLTAVWVVITIVLVVLLRVWVRRRLPRRRPATREERSFQLPPRAAPVPAREHAPATRPRRGEPHDAIGAYLAALDDIAEHDPANAHRSYETPRAHAVRTRAPTDLVALQADYALARYAGRALTAPETRRALDRWRRVRDRVRRLH